MPIEPRQIWPLVIVGRGSSAAYYVCHVDLELYKSVLAIGEDDAWAGKRGHAGDPSDPTLKINHPLHLIAHFKETIPGFDTALVDRLAWADMNSRALDEAHVQIYKATVSLVSDAVFPKDLTPEDDLGLRGFKIDLKTNEGPETVYAYKVVMCAGAGGHRVPTELQTARREFPKQVLDLDEFASLPASKFSPSTRVVVIGPNAAIDAVHKTLNYRGQIHWLISLEPDKAPAILETQPRMKDAWANPERNNLTVHRYSKYRAGARSGQRINVEVTLQEGRTKHIDGDYIVYGMGQDGEPVKMIDNNIQVQLKPILDRTGGLTSRGGGTAILGYEAEGTGLRTGFEVVGAMSAQVGRALNNSKNRLERLAELIEQARSARDVFMAITTGWPKGVKPFLAKDVDFLAKQPRPPLHSQLRREVDSVVNRNLSNPDLKGALVALANLILAYHTAYYYANLPQGDPNNLKNFQSLLNLVASNLPKGAVADAGQLTSINAALGAYATMNGNLPKYMPKQHYVLPGPRPKEQKGPSAPVVVTQTSGDVNFNLDNAQNLAIFICITYPNIRPQEANAFMDELMLKRRQSDIGFTDGEVLEFKRRLEAADLAALQNNFQRV